jgi:hypothetical protein
MRTTLLFIFLLIATTIYAQDYKQALVGNTWRLTVLKINEEVFKDAPNTCVYTTEISFVSDALLTLNRPCMSAPVTQKAFTIVNNLLIINSTDTLTITKLSLTSFETTIRQKAVDDSGNVTVMDIITTYEKK